MLTAIEPKKLARFIPFLLVLFAASWLRLKNLGYSDFQGDEIKALFLPTQGQSILDFLLAQRKGPMQFIVTYIIKLFDPLYINQFLVRLPFAVASILSVVFFYKFVGQFYSKKIAFYSAFFMTANGFFVAFARIAQYQSFVILFSVLALYMFSLALNSAKWRIAGLYYGMVFWALSLLSHYDGIFILPFVLFVLWKWLKLEGITQKTKLLHIFLAGAVCGVILALFYLPFVLSLTSSTLEYWEDRLEGGEQKLSSSIVTFKIYNPKLMFYIFSVLTGLFGLKVFWELFKRLLPLSTISRFAVPTQEKLHFDLTFSLVAWVLFPFLFMEVVTSVPGTHIYTYLMPAFILISLGLVFLEELVLFVLRFRYAFVLNLLGVAILFTFYFYLSHQVFVDNTYEYPWEEEKFLIWTLNKPNVVFHLSLFGFPYYRHWEEIGTLVMNGENNGFYSTNERKSISRHYIPFAKDTNSAGHFVYIRNPQTFTNDVTQEKAQYWFKHYDPIKTFYNKGRVVSKVYYMPAGPLEQIQLEGY